MFKKIITNAVATTSIILFSNSAFANNYPDKEINLRIGFNKNQTSDQIAEIFAQGFKKVSGQKVNIVTEPYIDGVNLAEDLMTSKPDGYTLALTNTSSLITTFKDEKNLSEEVSIIGNFAISPNIILVSNSFPAKDFRGFENEIKRAEGKYIFSSYGRDSISHLILESLKSNAGLKIKHLPYVKHSQALNDVVLNKIDGTFTNYIVAASLIKEGKVKPLAVLGNKRLESLPDIPTLKELGYPETNRLSFFTIVGPKNMPMETIKKVNKIIETVTQDPDVIEQLKNIGAEPEYMDGKDIQRVIVSDLQFYHQAQQI